MKKKLSAEDQALFRQAVRSVKKLTTPKVAITPPPPPLVKRKRQTFADDLPTLPLSDHEYLEPLGTEDSLLFAQPGVAHKTIRNLREGKYEVESVLDLHGMTVDEAREALNEFLFMCQKKGLVQVIIIHGKGHNQVKPILKNKVNHWLRQTELVLAFCSATPRDGGKGAVYVYLKKTPHR